MEKETMTASVMNLPILKHFEGGEISKSTNRFLKGEKSIFGLLKWIVIVGAGYLVWTYVLPTVFIALGQALAVVATGAIAVAAFIFAPVFMRWTRLMAKNVAKALIKQDPFGELEKQKGLMLVNQQKFRQSKGKIDSLKLDMEVESDKSEHDAVELQDKISKSHAKASRIKGQLDEAIKTQGVACKDTDEYVNKSAELLTILSDADRMSHQLKQSKEHVQKYGVRAAILKKFSHKLVMVGVALDNKIADFDVTVDILKKDYIFAQKAREATESARSAMMFTTPWELDYALDVVTSTIAEDIAITSGNLSDFDKIDLNALDSDEMFANLESLANKIKVGENSIPSAKNYRSSDYQPTSEDKLKSGGFGNLF